MVSVLHCAYGDEGCGDNEDFDYDKDIHKMRED